MSPVAPSDRHWVLVVEDEARLRDSLAESLVRSAPDFGPVRAVASAEEALVLCRSAFPAVAFVDIRLPGMSGLELARSLAEHSRVVLVTAHQEFALDAFERGVMDYLLKPVSAERLQLCLDRLRARRAAPGEPQRAAMEAPAPMQAAPAYVKWLSATSGRRTYLIAVEDIVYLQSDHKYTRLVCRDSEHLVEDALKKILSRLDPEMFRQVHRSAAINLGELLLIEREEGGSGLVRFRHHADIVRISAPYMRALRMFLV